jgi:hypothetical protein
MNGTYTLRPQTIVSTIYGFHVPERVLAQLLPAVANGQATLQMGAAGSLEHLLRTSNDSTPLVVSERERGDIMPDCYVLADAAAMEWQGPVLASLSVTAPPVDNTERDRMRRITTAKQLELKKHQTSLMEKPTRGKAKSLTTTTTTTTTNAVAATTSTTTATSMVAKKSRTNSAANVHQQTQAVPSVADASAVTQLLNSLAVAPLSRRYVSETFPSLSAATLGELAELKNNSWQLRFDKFDLVDLNHPFFVNDEKKRNAAQARILQSRSIRGLTADPAKKRTSATTAAAAEPPAPLTEYQRQWIQHNQLHAELEQRRMRFASMATMYFDKSSMSFAPDIDAAAVTQQLDREEKEFRDKLAQYNACVAQLVVLERQQQG